VRGLTTAAGIWAVAAVGMAVATDRYLLAVLATVLIMVVFAAERPFDQAPPRQPATTPPHRGGRGELRSGTPLTPQGFGLGCRRRRVVKVPGDSRVRKIGRPSLRS
jgi:hypothetical protein